MRSNAAVIGIDAGGTKTAGVLARPDGTVVAVSKAGAGNYQVTGLDAAIGTYEKVLTPLWAATAEAGLEVVSMAFGLSGLDRPKDDARLRPRVATLVPKMVPWTLVNDTFLILRAGSERGHGVAVVSGTGSNCVGLGRDGREERIGGLGGDFGDDGSGDAIARTALRAAFRGQDGRAPETSLTEKIIQLGGFERLDDILDAFMPGSGAMVLPMGTLAPLVFDAAAEGDEVAREILVAAGEELGLSAALIAGRLFDPTEAFPLVLGGSVLQKASIDTMERALVDHVRARFPEVEPVRLEGPPILGAVKLAIDLASVAGLLPTEGAR